MFRTVSTNQTHRRPGAKLAVLLAVPLFVGMLTACSPGNDPEKPDGSGKGDTAEVSFEDWQLKFASCMRDQGIDMPDPTSEGQKAMTLDEANGDAFQAAQDTCMSEVGDPPAPPGGQMTEEEFLEAQVETAGCLRENGFDVEDPKPELGLTLPQDIPEEILKECMPGYGGGGGGAVSVAPAG